MSERLNPPTTLSTIIDDRVLLVGLGSSHGDDRIGWLVSARIAGDVQGLRAVQLATPVDLLNVISDVDHLVIVDACRGTGEIGTAHRWRWPTREVAVVQAAGTHAIGLPEVLEMAERLGILPNSVIIWGITGHCFSPGSVTSLKLLHAIDRCIPQIAADCQMAHSPTETGG